jgi:esterase/lipase
MNLKPESLVPMAKILAEKNFSVFLPAFHGHCASRGDYLQAKSSEWLQDAEQFYREAERKSQEKKVPLFLVAYSFSALIYQVRGDLPFAKKVYLAPALATKFWYPWLIAVAKIFPDFHFPSRNLPQYAANSHSSLRGILALDDLLQKFQSGKGHADQTQGLIILDPKDELVDAEGVLDFVQKSSNRKFLPISNEGHSLPKTYHHLIVTPESLSPSEWKRMIQAIEDFLFV